MCGSPHELQPSPVGNSPPGTGLAIDLDELSGRESDLDLLGPSVDQQVAVPVRAECGSGVRQTSRVR